MYENGTGAMLTKNFPIGQYCGDVKTGQNMYRQFMTEIENIWKNI